MSTDKQINANRQNAQQSTGPRTEQGKAKSSLNAIKTGLTGRTVLLPCDDLAAYQEHLASLEDHHKPETNAENLLVQSIADTEWRLTRIPSLEAGIYAIGRMELRGQFEDEEEAVRRILMDAKVFLAYGRQLNNLSVQEARLRRQREKDLAELKKSQTRREEQREFARKRPFTAAAEAVYPKLSGKQESGSKPVGFEFSAREVFQRLATKSVFGPGLKGPGQPPHPAPSPAETDTSEDLPHPEAA